MSSWRLSWLYVGKIRASGFGKPVPLTTAGRLVRDRALQQSILEQRLEVLQAEMLPVPDPCRRLHLFARQLPHLGRFEHGKYLRGTCGVTTSVTASSALWRRRPSLIPKPSVTANCGSRSPASRHRLIMPPVPVPIRSIYFAKCSDCASRGLPGTDPCGWRGVCNAS